MHRPFSRSILPLSLTAGVFAVAALLAAPAGVAPAAEPKSRRTVEKPDATRAQRTPVRQTTRETAGEASLEQRVADLEAQVAQLLEVIQLQGNDVAIVSSAALSLRAGEDLSLEADRDVKVDAGSDLELEAAASLKANANGEIRQQAGSVYRVDAPQVVMP